MFQLLVFSTHEIRHKICSHCSRRGGLVSSCALVGDGLGLTLELLPCSPAIRECRTGGGPWLDSSDELTL